MNENYSTNLENEPKIEILSVKPEDVMGIRELEYETWLATYPNKEAGITLDDLKYKYRNLLSEEKLNQMRKLIEGIDDNMMFLVAKVKGKIVGVAFFEKEETHNRFSSLYILPEYQSKGIGKRFWEEAKKFFDPMKDTLVDVVAYNEKAINFYKKLGFVDTGKRFSEYKEGMEKVAIRPLMEMKLSGEKG